MEGKTIMVTETQDRKSGPERRSVKRAVKKGDAMRLPHERDATPDAQGIEPREIIKQAASDLEQGLVDTDLHGIRGVETVAPAPPQCAQPIPKKGKQ